MLDSLVSKYFYDKIRKIERDSREEITTIRLIEAQHTHNNELEYIKAMYQANIMNLKAKYGE